MLALVAQIRAGNDDYYMGARSAALGHASIAISDVWSVFHNQAGLASIKTLQVGAYYESRFFLEALSIGGGAFVIPTHSGVFGLSIYNFGDDFYSEGKYGLSYGKELGEKFSLGMQLNYLNIRLGNDYGSRNTVTGEVGMLAEVSDKITLGAHVYNPTRNKLADFNNEKIPTILRLGLKYDVSDKVMLVGETEKDIDKKPRLKAGIEYQLFETIHLRGGISTEATFSSFGFGVKLNEFMIDFGTNYHNVLGYSTQIGLSYNFSK